MNKTVFASRGAQAFMLVCAITLVGCSGVPTVPGTPAPAPGTSNTLNCDDGIRRAFSPDGETTVVSVRQIRKGEELLAVDSPSPVKAAADLCLVKLLVGPGVTAEKDASAKSFSQGIGIEIWLPTAANWNERIRDYGGGGWVGGGHRVPDKIGSKVPAIVNANIGFAVGTTDAGQPWYQNGSFAFLSNGKLNQEAFRDFSYRATLETARHTQALVKLYYGRAQKFAYFDGQSQGGRQGMKIAQDYPELYDGYLIAQPALSVQKFGLQGLYTQIVLKAELGFNALDKVRAQVFAKKVEAVNVRAVKSCDKAGLGFLLDPFSCNYDPLKDPGALCVGVAGAQVDGKYVHGSNSDTTSCMSAREAGALNKIWYGASSDGSYDSNQTPASRSGQVLGDKQLWWAFTRGSNIGGTLRGAGADGLAVILQDVTYAADASVASGIPIENKSTTQRNRWSELTYASFAQAFQRGVDSQAAVSSYMTDNADLSRLRALGKKIIMHNGLAEDAIPPAGAVNYYTRVAAAMGGDANVQAFMRMYMIPGMAHSSQGRAYTVGGNNSAVPMPKLPGNGNQTPTREQDQMFSALQDWVEAGRAPQAINIVSADRSVSYPICVYPLRTTWDGVGSAKAASSYACK